MQSKSICFFIEGESTDMQDKQFYLSERIYAQEKNKQINYKQYDYWKTLLGEDVMKHLCYNKNFSNYLRNQPYKYRDEKKKMA